MSFGFHVLHLDKKNDNVLESCSDVDNENIKNTSIISKSLLAKESNIDCPQTDEEKRLLHLSRLL